MDYKFAKTKMSSGFRSYIDIQRTTNVKRGLRLGRALLHLVRLKHIRNGIKQNSPND